ncbi:MAG: DUF2938 domain-containing protein [Pseudomonadota bacterium]
MAILTSEILAASCVGIGATAIMDIWAIFLRRTFNIASADYCLVGRWFCHMPAGRFVHQSIGKASKKPGECVVGWVAHYMIGVVYAVALVMLMSGDWLQQPTLLPAVLVGLGTLLFPFFVMQPAFSLGIAAALSPNPTQARLRSVSSHMAFGIGLYLAALSLSFL